jgi:hypothetical protein
MPAKQTEIIIALGDDLSGLYNLFPQRPGAGSVEIIDCADRSTAIFRNCKVALLRLDYKTQHMSEVVKLIGGKFPGAQLIILSLYLDEIVLFELDEAGRQGYLRYGSEIYKFVSTITSVADLKCPNEEIMLFLN